MASWGDPEMELWGDRRGCGRAASARPQERGSWYRCLGCLS